jgi:murein peptide amidase A
VALFERDPGPADLAGRDAAGSLAALDRMRACERRCARPRIVVRVLRSHGPIVTTTVIASLLAAGCGVSAGSASSRHGRARAVAPRPEVPAGRVRRAVLLGRSVQHRPIRAWELGEPSAGRRALIVGCIHGDERAGISVARSLLAALPPRGVDLWVLDDLNPDGAAAGTRQNASGVDLNRNFPYGWRPAGRPGDQQYPGPRPLSEPEARIAHRLILRLRPQITIFFHQPLGLVDESGGDPRFERRFAQLSGLPLRRLTRYPGSAVGWQNHRLPTTTAFAVELPPGRVTPPSTARLARAVLALAHGLPPREGGSTRPPLR